MRSYRDILAPMLPKSVHVTCVAHMIHNVTETARSSFPNVDRLVSSVKNVFKKFPKRIQAFKKRWCSWLVAVQYLAEHHEKVLTVVESCSENDAVSIAVAKELLSSSTVI